MQNEQTPFTMKLEVVPIPVSDVDRAIDFYANQVGFHLDHDVSPSDTMRVVQLTPPGSACSMVIGKGLGELSEMLPGSVKGVHLVVADIAAARDTLMQRGVEVSAVNDRGRGVKDASFRDPDGNSWVLQELSY